jgi:acylphosphatase
MSESKEARERREICFSGQVQGVGFRYTTREIAARFPVCGYVKNLRDGRVLLVVEGTSGVLDGFVEAVDGELDRHIERREVSILPATDEFTRFEVLR